jgi:hypothetical protein
LPPLNFIRKKTIPWLLQQPEGQQQQQTPLLAVMDRRATTPHLHLRTEQSPLRHTVAAQEQEVLQALIVVAVVVLGFLERGEMVRQMSQALLV